jgi:hypothetical protein
VTEYINRMLTGVTPIFAVTRKAWINRFHRPVRRAAVFALAVALVWVFASEPQKAYAGSTHTPWKNLSQSQLTAVWWQWALSIPEPDNPLFDYTGSKAYKGQPYSDLLFLVGTIGVGTATRSISVKQGTALFFPLVNSEWDNICLRPHLGANCFEKPPRVLGVPDLRAIAAGNVSPATDLHATLTSTDATFTMKGTAIDLSKPRLQSPPFSYTLPATDNIYQFLGVDVSGTVAPAAGDGYYTFIPAGPLAAGSYYLLEFGGTAPAGTQAITYKITVTP